MPSEIQSTTTPVGGTVTLYGDCGHNIPGGEQVYVGTCWRSPDNSRRPVRWHREQRCAALLQHGEHSWRFVCLPCASLRQRPCRICVGEGPDA